jgi:hypothetical protein
VTNAEPFPGVDVHVGRSVDLGASEREQVHEIFDRCYALANHAYLDRSMSRMRYIARALRHGTLLGFTLSDARFEPLPRFDEPQLVLLAGIGCIEPEHRRSRLFSHIAALAANASGLLAKATTHFLVCGRMGHPAGFRSMKDLPAVVPRAGKPLSDWHLEVAACVAELYGSRLKPGSMVVDGGGQPIGFPRIEIDVAAEEWTPFRDVDRDRGDSLLALAWSPDAPPGW